MTGAVVVLWSLWAGAVAWGAPKKPEAMAAADKAFAAGKYKAAASAYSRLIGKTAALPPRFMAQALLRRGIAYRNLGRPSRAIADLTAALWIKGLTAAERQMARENLGKAYRAAGVTPPAAGVGRASTAQGKQAKGTGHAAAAKTQAPAAAIPAFATQVSRTPPASRQDGRGEKRKKVPAKRPIKPPARTASPKKKGKSIPAFATHVEPAGKEMPAPSEGDSAPATGGGGVAGFFSNLFAPLQPQEQTVANPADARKRPDTSPRKKPASQAREAAPAVTQDWSGVTTIQR